MRPFPILLCVLCVLCGKFETVQAASKDRPNIIFLLADDMGYGDLGCYGSPVIQSPNLDALAASGIQLTQCYAASSNCSPSRTGMLTGRSPYRVGMYDFARFKPLHIPESETTVAELLRDQGYATMFAGKWHCSGDFESGDQPYPGDHGFDHWLANATNFGKDPETFRRNGEKIGKIEGWMSELVVDEAINFINEHTAAQQPQASTGGRKDGKTRRPFFTCLWFSEPHTPVLAADEFRALYPEDKIKDHVAELKTSGGPQVIRRPNIAKPDLYFGCVSMLDHHIGRLLDHLDEQGLRENTLIVFTSDNGPEHRTGTAFGSSAHFRGAKGHMHEGGIHVPGIVSWPGHLTAGTTSEEPVNGTDWLPTLCAAAGIDTPNVDKVLDGANVLPALRGQGATDREHPMMWWLWHARGGYEVAMRDGDYKILATMLPQPNPGGIEDARTPEGMPIMDFIKTAELGNFQFFNLTKDPSETTDLTKSQPERYERLRKKMVALHAEIRTEGPTYDLASRKKKK